jgi:hypothetical protein
LKIKVALSLGGLRRRIEIALLPDHVDVVMPALSPLLGDKRTLCAHFASSSSLPIIVIRNRQARPNGGPF